MLLSFRTLGASRKERELKAGLALFVLLGLTTAAFGKHAPPLRAHDNPYTGYTCYCGCCPDPPGVDQTTGACAGPNGSWYTPALGVVILHTIAQCSGNPTDIDYCIEQCNQLNPSICKLQDWQAVCTNYPPTRRYTKRRHN